MVECKTLAETGIKFLYLKKSNLDSKPNCAEIKTRSSYK
jgi:hypothetical protein